MKLCYYVNWCLEGQEYDFRLNPPADGNEKSTLKTKVLLENIYNSMTTGQTKSADEDRMILKAPELLLNWFCVEKCWSTVSKIIHEFFKISYRLECKKLSITLKVQLVLSCYISCWRILIEITLSFVRLTILVISMI